MFCLEVLYWLLLFRIELSQKQNLIHLVLHVLLVSQSLCLTSPCAISLCLQPLAIQLCFQHLWKALSCSGIILDKLAGITCCVKDLLCECTRISLQYPPCFILPPPASCTCACTHTHTRWLMVQFNPYSTGICSLSIQPACGRGRGESSAAKQGFFRAGREDPVLNPHLFARTWKQIEISLKGWKFVSLEKYQP